MTLTRKELKEQYKQKKPEMGIFQIKNNVTGKKLIQQSADVQARWNRIRSELRFGSHRNTALQKDWSAQSHEDFEFSVLTTLEIKEGENVNLNKELDALMELTLEEAGIDREMLY